MEDLKRKIIRNFNEDKLEEISKDFRVLCIYKKKNLLNNYYKYIYLFIYLFLIRKMGGVSEGFTGILKC